MITLDTDVDGVMNTLGDTNTNLKGIKDLDNRYKLDKKEILNIIDEEKGYQSRNLPGESQYNSKQSRNGRKGKIVEEKNSTLVQ